MGAFRREVRKPKDEWSPALKKWKQRGTDTQQYNRWKTVAGKYMPETLDEFLGMKYNKDKQQAFENLRQIKEQEKVYKIAAEGGAHSGKLKNYQNNYSVANLKKNIRSLNKQIENHLIKINSPIQVYADWNDKPKQYQEGCIKHWQKEVQDFIKERNIALAVLRRKEE